MLVPESMESLCAVASECGGCPLIGVAPQAQKAQKLEDLRRWLSRFSVPTPSEGVGWLPHSGPVGYRNRIRLRLDGGLPTFFNPNKDHECAVLESRLKEKLGAFRRWASSRTSVLRAFAHIELRVSELDDWAGLTLNPISEDGAARELAAFRAGGSWQQELAELGIAVWVAGEGPAPVQRSALVQGGYSLVPLSAFRQVNRWVNTALLHAMLQMCDTRLGRGEPLHFLDLYCGAGNLGLTLLEHGGRGDFIETEPSAVAALCRAAEEQGWSCGEARVGDAALAATSRAPAPHYDLVLINPPRAGVRAGMAGVAELEVRAALAIYCSPRSFARDAADLLSRGFELKELHVADMFPHTTHYETLGWFERH